MSNLGLRRLLATAAKQRDVFWLRFTRLDGATGDEAWRVGSTGREYVVRGSRDGTMTCTRIGWGGFESACDAKERALLLEPQEAISRALTYFLIPQPNPIVPGYTDEMHCVTWG